MRLGGRPAFPRVGKLASPTGMSREGFPHGIFTAREHRTDHAIAHVLSVQAQVSEHVKQLGHREIPIRLRIGGAPVVTAWLRQGRPLSPVTLARPRGQRCGKQPVLIVIPRRDAIERLPIVGVMPAGLAVVPQRLLGAMCAEGRLDGVPLVRDGGTPRRDGRPVESVQPVAHHAGRLFLGGDRVQALEQARAQQSLVCLSGHLPHRQPCVELLERRVPRGAALLIHVPATARGTRVAGDRVFGHLRDLRSGH